MSATSDVHSQSARVFFRLVRDFSRSRQPWETALYHEVSPDERWDLTRVSRRVYGTPEEAIAVMAAAGLDRVDQPIPQVRLVLPTPEQLRQFKREAGFESLSAYRRDNRPTWSPE